MLFIYFFIGSFSVLSRYPPIPTVCIFVTRGKRRKTNSALFKCSDFFVRFIFYSSPSILWLLHRWLWFMQDWHMTKQQEKIDFPNGEIFALCKHLFMRWWFYRWENRKFPLLINQFVSFCQRPLSGSGELIVFSFANRRNHNSANTTNAKYASPSWHTKAKTKALSHTLKILIWLGWTIQFKLFRKLELLLLHHINVEHVRENTYSHTRAQLPQ